MKAGHIFLAAETEHGTLLLFDKRILICAILVSEVLKDIHNLRGHFGKTHTLAMSIA